MSDAKKPCCIKLDPNMMSKKVSQEKDYAGFRTLAQDVGPQDASKQFFLPPKTLPRASNMSSGRSQEATEALEYVQDRFQIV